MVLGRIYSGGQQEAEVRAPHSLLEVFPSVLLKKNWPGNSAALQLILN